MKGPYLKIDGVYDSKTILHLKELSINHFSFDFRPRSFNFIQEYKFLEILKKVMGRKNYFYLHFANEKDFVIQKILDDLSNQIKEQGHLEYYQNNFFLEFSGTENIEFCQSFGQKFYMTIHSRKNIFEILQNYHAQLHGLIIDHLYLSDLQRTGEFFSFIEEIKDGISKYQQKFKKDLSLVLLLDWNSNMIPSLVDAFGMSGFSLPVNNQVEDSYRQVNVEKLQSKLASIALRWTKQDLRSFL